MLRSIFVVAIILYGGFYAVQGPFYFLLFYLWYAYFRPDEWIFWLTWVQSLNLSLFLGIGLLISTVFSVPKLRFNATVALMVLFLGQSVLSTIFSAHPNTSWDAWQIFIRVWLVAYILIILVTDLARFRLTLLIIALSLGAEAAKQGWVGFILNPGGVNNNTLPFMGDNNGVAVGMMMLVPLFSALAHTTTKRWERSAYWFLTTGVVLRGLLTYSRGGFLSALVLAIFYWLQSRNKIRSLVSLALVSTLVLSVMPQQFWDRMNTITTPAGERDESARGRLHFWGVAADMAAANPLLGVGFDGFEASYNTYDRSGGEFGGDRAVHSTWFGVLADTGYVGFAMYAGLFLLTVWNLLLVRRRAVREGATEIAAYSTAISTSLLVFSTGGAFVNLQYNEMFWHFIALGAAIQVIAEAAPIVEVAAATSEIPEAGYLRREPLFAWGVSVWRITMLSGSVDFQSCRGPSSRLEAGKIIASH